MRGQMRCRERCSRRKYKEDQGMLLEKNLEKKNNKYMVGFDLGDRDAQISFCSVQQKEAETLPALAGTRQYNIPSVSSDIIFILILCCLSIDVISALKLVLILENPTFANGKAQSSGSTAGRLCAWRRTAKGSLSMIYFRER